MAQEDPNIEAVAGALLVSIGLLRRNFRQVLAEGELTLPETSALARLDRGGPMTGAALARLEQISPQSMGATLATLKARGLITSAPDPDDGRRLLISATPTGLQLLQNRRNVRTKHLAAALATGFTRAEIKQLLAAAPLIERLAQSI
jgi:DNA-binding MarR family transcriptional regulator